MSPFNHMHFSMCTEITIATGMILLFLLIHAIIVFAAHIEIEQKKINIKINFLNFQRFR